MLNVHRNHKAYKGQYEPSNNIVNRCLTSTETIRLTKDNKSHQKQTHSNSCSRTQRLSACMAVAAVRTNQDKAAKGRQTEMQGEKQGCREGGRDSGRELETASGPKSQAVARSGWISGAIKMATSRSGASGRPGEEHAVCRVMRQRGLTPSRAPPSGCPAHARPSPRGGFCFTPLPVTLAPKQQGPWPC